MRYLIVFYDGDTTIINGHNLEYALFDADLKGHSAESIISAVKLDD